MNNRLSLYLVLGCNGSREEQFTYCHTTENILLDLATLSDSDYNIVVDFLDDACELFDGPIGDQNKVANIISILYRTFKVINDITLYKTQRYLKMHRDCGMYLVLLLQEDYDE